MRERDKVDSEVIANRPKGPVIGKFGCSRPLAVRSCREGQRRSQAPGT